MAASVLNYLRGFTVSDMIKTSCCLSIRSLEAMSSKLIDFECPLCFRSCMCEGKEGEAHFTR